MKQRCSCSLRITAAVAAGVLAWSAATAALTSSVRVTLPAAMDRAATLDDYLASLAALLALGLLGWLALAIGAATLAELLPAGGQAAHRVRRLATAITPAAARRVLAVLITGVLFTGTGQVAEAAPVPTAVSTAWGTVGSEVDSEVDSGVDSGIGPQLDPARSLDSTRPRLVDLDPSWGTPGRLRARGYPNESVVVRRGDTLWDIAARHLGRTATDAEIALSWPRWFAANRDTIGPDPDRLMPGQRLHPPLPPSGGPS